MIPQIIAIILLLLNILMHGVKHREITKYRYNMWYAIIISGLLFWLLIWGGFFN